MIKSLAIAAISSLTLAGIAKADVTVVDFAAPTTGSNPTSTVAGISASNLQYDGLPTNLEAHSGGWTGGPGVGGNTISFDMTVNAGSQLSISGYSLTLTGFSNAGHIDFTGSVLSSGDIGSVVAAIPGPEGGDNGTGGSPWIDPTPAVGVASPNLLLAPGNYTVSVYGFSPDAVPGGFFAGFEEVQLTGTVSPVPEPASLGLLAVGSIGLLARRRRKA
jgi:hypothetical protein